MKKLVNPVFGGSISLLAFIASLSILISWSSYSYGQDCILSCPPMSPPVQFSLSSACVDVVTYEDLGVVPVNCMPPIFNVEIIDNGTPIGNIVTASMIGNTYMVVITHPSSGQSCMTMMIVLDKQDPELLCPDDVTLDCTTDLDLYTGLDPWDINDCSETTVSIDDDLVFSGICQGTIYAQYIRTYTVQDLYLNVATCQQVISLAKANIGDVDFPPDLTGVNALDCSPAPNTSPSGTGYPNIDGKNILPGNFCNLSAGFIDVTISLCSGSYKIARTWTVIDWCPGSPPSTATQIIEVLDQTPPVVTAPLDITISTSASSCTADVVVAPATLVDDCSNIGLINVRMETPFGTVFSNGGMISNLPVGVHQIKFKAITDCAQQGEDIMYITVQDLQPPAPVCNAQLAIPLNNEGEAIIPAYIFNAGSYDNCGDVYFKVKRMTAPAGYTCSNEGNPNNMFDDFIQFCCEDIAHNNIMVILRVYDVQPVAGPVPDDYLAGHFNNCMVQVEIQDKLPPAIICPSDLTISCQFPFTMTNLNVFGKVVLDEADRDPICLDDPGDGLPGVQCPGLDGLATDNCFVTVTSTATSDINMCGTGKVYRTFTATDDGGISATCVQTITIINFYPFHEGLIDWPEDYTTTNICDVDLLDPEDLDYPYNAPVITEGPCDLVPIPAYEDDVFDFSNHDQACFKILRTWTVIDWCQLGSGNGTWEHIQVIKVMNSDPPVISGVEDLTECSYDPECGGVVLDFEAEASDLCSGPNSLTWKYYIDIDNNAIFDFVSQASTGGSISFSYDMPIGHHRILYTVWDQCGNTAVKEQLVTVNSCKGPSAKCHALQTNLMGMDMNNDGILEGMVVLWASMFDAGSDHPCGNEFSLAFSEDPLNITKVFTCADFGLDTLEIWVIDENGLTDVCITTVDVQDNNNVCPPSSGGTSGVIAGNISVPQAGKLSGAMVYLDGSNQGGIPTTSEGYFLFPAIPFGGQYVVRPVKEGDAKNGVSTIDLVKMQKHLLGIEPFNSPYQYIAADINNSSGITAIDLLQLRKLILGYYTEFPNNHSWRFIDDAYLFPDPHNPWTAPWPETYNIIPFSTNMNDVNFDAIKIGDINLSASLQATGSVIIPRSGQRGVVDYVIREEPETDVFKVDLYLQDARQYNALQFSFDWDQKGYTLMDWQPGDQLHADEVRMPAQDRESASLSTFTMTAWPEGKMHLLTLWLKRNPQMVYPFQLFLKPRPTAALAYRAETEEEVSVQLNGSPLKGMALLNKPNPFRDMTIITISSEREEEAVLRVYDLNGKIVHTRSLHLVKGENECVVHKSDLKIAGMYTYEIESGFQYSTNRMIIVD